MHERRVSAQHLPRPARRRRSRAVFPSLSGPFGRIRGYNFGNGFYNDHHFHYGYFIYSAAVLAKYRPSWEKQWRPQLLALIRDYANPSTADGFFPLTRHKDWFMGFSWAGGIKFEPLGRNQESVSEAINSCSELRGSEQWAI